MKRFNRILAALIAVLMLCGACTTVAEMDVDLTLDAQGNPGSIELEIDPEAWVDEPDGGLELDDGLQMDGVDLLNPELEIGIEDNLLIDGAEAQGDESVQSNDSDSDFEIKNGVLLHYWGKGSHVAIPDGVTKIGKYAFSKCYSLTSVTIPDGVTSIGEDAFSYCYVLTRVTIPASIVRIEKDAFYKCYSLSSAAIPYGVTSIGERAFEHCNLENVTIPASVTRIGVSAFGESKHLESVTILAQKINIDGWAFDNEYTIGGYSKPIIYIIADSNAIEWAKEYNYDYHIIKNALSEKQLKLESEQTHWLFVLGKKDDNIIWSSSNQSVATVDNGKVTAKKVGKCVISATLENGKTLKCNVTIYDPAEISDTKLTKYVGGSYKLKVTGLLKRKVTWTSSNTAVATVKNGKVTAIKAGECTITATLSKGKYLAKKNLKCNLTVIDNATISNKTLSLKIGEDHKLTITGLAKRKVTWSSSNTTVATVRNGVVKAIKEGKCTITAQIKNGKKLTCKLTVTDPAALSAEKLTISTIDSDKITLTGALKRKVTWSTSDANVVKISKSDPKAASIKAVNTGTATITAKIEGGKTLKCAITVVNPLTIKEDWDDDFDELASWEVGVKFTNHSNKKVIYVTFDILQYNNRGDRLKSPYDYYYFNNDIDPHSSYWDNYTVNDDTRSVKFKIREVTFADKTTWRP